MQDLWLRNPQERRPKSLRVGMISTNEHMKDLMELPIKVLEHMEAEELEYLKTYSLVQGYSS